MSSSLSRLRPPISSGKTRSRRRVTETLAVGDEVVQCVSTYLLTLYTPQRLSVAAFLSLNLSVSFAGSHNTKQTDLD